ncbi:MAG: putative glycoside hydrolase [Polyangiaceae bacterium]|nr:putative glycoside hydrolase [Polyangiaceae bacterium]
MLPAVPALAASHPPGVGYPLEPAALQPAGLAQPLPSTRRYVLVWKDQLADAVQGVSQAQKQWIVQHYVGSQKLFKRQIDEYRAMNPGFLLLVYHLAYGLNGADQTNPVHNITGADRWGQEDDDAFTPYVAAHALTRENAYEHGTSTGFPNDRIHYPDPFWLMNLDSSEWRSYLFDTLLEWQGYATDKATGVFLDVAFHPWYGYQPTGWWAPKAGGSSHAALASYWNPRASAYFKAMRAAFAATSQHPRYLVIPNPDSLVDEEPAFLDETDGVFTENWQDVADSAGNWYVSSRRLCRYVTSKGKVWIAGITAAGTSLSASERALLVGTYLLVRNGTSYFTLGLDDVSWYPEYELDLGGYEREPPEDLEQLRVGGSGGGAGGLYARRYVSGLVLVNSSSAALTYTLPSAMKRATWSGGGDVDASAQEPSYALDYDTDVPAGALTVPARTAIILRAPAGAPPPGVEPAAGAGGAGGAAGAAGSSGAAASAGAGGAGATAGAAGNSAGAPGKAGAAGAPTSGGAAGASAGGGAAGDSGCGCRAAGVPGRRASALGGLSLAALAALRRRASRRLRARSDT